MSLEWKMKLHSVYGQLLFDRNLRQVSKKSKPIKALAELMAKRLRVMNRTLKKTSLIYLEDSEIKSTSQAQLDVFIFRRKMER